MSEQGWIVIVLVFSLVTTASGAFRVLFRSCQRSFTWIGMLLLFALQTAALIHRGVVTGECPVHGVSDVIFFMAWALNAFYLCLGRMYRMSILGAFTAPAVALCMVGALMALSKTDIIIDNRWVTWHVALAMTSYGALGMAAVAGGVFLIQDFFLKEHRITEISSKLPPIRNLQMSLGRLMVLGFILLGLSQIFAYISGIPIPMSKAVVAAAVTLAYFIALSMIYLRGMPGRVQALVALFLYIGSLAIFLVL